MQERMPAVHCRFCGKKLLHNRKEGSFCSRRCAIQYQRCNPSTTRLCLWCGELFTTSHYHERHCSRLCEATHGLHDGTLRLMDDPWQSGDVGAGESSSEYWRVPDGNFGF